MRRKDATVTSNLKKAPSKDQGILSSSLTRRGALTNAAAFAALGGLQAGCGGAPTRGADSAFLPTEKSLDTHTTPQWFKDAKFGIFIHWGPYSIPAFAPTEDNGLSEKFGYGFNPYAEWYWHSMKFEGAPTAEYHRKTYGADYPYERFGEAFNDSLDDWNPDEWARLFKRSGARYVVLGTKHHDGFILWPSARPNPHIPNWGTKRDVVGELAEAVRAQGMRFGVYYSGGVDWTFQPKLLESRLDFMLNMPGKNQGYTKYADAHYRELIDRYKPDILWNDIGYPSHKSAFEIIAHYYNTVPEGLVNDRWLNLWSVFRKETWEGTPDYVEGSFFPKPPVWDIRTPEYAIFNRLVNYDWETTRGIGHSFGYNRMETEEDFLSVAEIAQTLAQASAYNGNLLLNVGPRGDTIIDPPQAQRLEGIGQWLALHGSAIKDTTPVAVPQQDLRVGATKNETNGFLHLLEKPKDQTITVALPDDFKNYSKAEALHQEGLETEFSSGAVTVRAINGWLDAPVIVTLSKAT
ncbi:MAG: alpha-L-fucosidase [Pseudomonadota bacterium]